MLVPGKALAGVIDLCKAKWPPDFQQLMPEVHQLVVQSLKQQSEAGSALQQTLDSDLTRLRHLAAAWQT